MEDVYQYRNAAAIVRSVEACAFHKVVALEKIMFLTQTSALPKVQILG